MYLASTHTPATTVLVEVKKLEDAQHLPVIAVKNLRLVPSKFSVEQDVGQVLG